MKPKDLFNCLMGYDEFKNHIPKLTVKHCYDKLRNERKTAKRDQKKFIMQPAGNERKETASPPAGLVKLLSRPAGNERKETASPARLVNFGSTCFINVILQSLTHAVPFVRALRSSTHPPCGLEFCVVCALRVLIEISSTGEIIRPSQFYDNLSHQQQDAYEFFQGLLNKLEDNNIVQQVFEGRSVSKLRCCNCGHSSPTDESFIDLSLGIEDAETLQKALESFTKPEKMEKEAKCNRCKVAGYMEKETLLYQAPSVAALHLKRFQFETHNEKIQKHVNFSLELDLVPYSDRSNNTQEHLKYQLYAVVVHVGSSSNTGHYFCYVRSSPSIWHKLNDEVVTRVSEKEVLSQAAYILFYVRDDHVPLFSSLMHTQKDPNTSSKSVLDTAESECTAYCAENLDICMPMPLSCEPVVEDVQMNQTGINTEDIAVQSKNPEGKLCCGQSKEDVKEMTESRHQSNNLKLEKKMKGSRDERAEGIGKNVHSS